MATPEQLDKTYLEQILAEHKELRRLMAEFQCLLADTACEKRQLSSRITALVDHCQAHFAEEETGGYMHDVLKVAPRLTHRANALLAQHERLLESLERLRVLVQSGVESNAWRRRVKEEFAELVHALSEHESGENRLVLDAFSLDLGAGD